MKHKDLPLVAERIERERQLGGYTYQELADIAGMDVATLFKICKGGTPSPGLETLMKLADEAVFDCSLDYLAGRVERADELYRPKGRERSKPLNVIPPHG